MGVWHDAQKRGCSCQIIPPVTIPDIAAIAANDTSNMTQILRPGFMLVFLVPFISILLSP
jgi:hypothetical protein